MKADIKANGFRHPIEVDAAGNILDGHHRYEIGRELKIDVPTKRITGFATDEEKQAYAIRVNALRRNMSPDQRRDLLTKQQAIARRLRESDPKRWTQREVATVLGVARQTVTDWFGHNAGSGNVSIPLFDARVKVPPQKKPDVAVRVG